MSSTAKERLQILNQMIDAHLGTLTHSDDRAGYIAGARDTLTQHAKAGKGSKHVSAIDGR